MKEQCIPLCLDLTIRLLKPISEGAAEGGGEGERGGEEELGEQVLDCLSRLTPWIDIHLVVNESVLPVLYALLPLPRYQVHAVRCISAVLVKGSAPFPSLSIVSWMISVLLLHAL